MLLYRLHESSVDFRLRRPDGITRHIRIVAEPVLDDQGRLYSVRGACQDVSAQHWTEVALAATRDQLASTEAESADRTRLALQLQQAIMPPAPAPLEVPGIRIAVRYRPAESQSLVGGDWYDAFVLPDKKILISVGDVAGHGIQAATGMVVLRNALRGLAVTGAGLAQLLSWLNTVTYHLTSHLTATAVCGIYDPDTRCLRWARAGHLPPVLVRGRRPGPSPWPRARCWEPCPTSSTGRKKCSWNVRTSCSCTPTDSSNAGTPPSPNPWHNCSPWRHVPRAVWKSASTTC